MKANHMPGIPRLTLRRKGALLFAAISAYVLAGAGFLAWHAVQSLGSSGRAMPILGAASVVALLGLVVFGTFLTLFLGRLSTDVARVQARAVEVAGGLRGAPLQIDRDDEVGELARAVDKMSADLREREAEIAAARLEQFHSERMMLLGGIASRVAHEIGNPAAAIDAYAGEIEAAQRAARPPECDARELANLARRLAATTRRLAAIAGMHSKEPGPVVLNTLVENVVALVALDARFRRIELVAEPDRNLPSLWLAEDDVVQLLFHLLVNAAEALADRAPADPWIRVATGREGDWVVLEVADNGRGMDAATAARGPEPLFTTKPAGRGSGLGLDACRRIVERHGGSIRLESAPGRGTRAVCRFPAAGGIGPDGAVLDSISTAGIGT